MFRYSCSDILFKSLLLIKLIDLILFVQLIEEYLFNGAKKTFTERYLCPIYRVKWAPVGVILQNVKIWEYKNGWNISHSYIEPYPTLLRKLCQQFVLQLKIKNQLKKNILNKYFAIFWTNISQGFHTRQHCRLSICRFLEFDKYHQKQIQNQSDDELSWLVYLAVGFCSKIVQ